MTATRPYTFLVGAVAVLAVGCSSCRERTARDEEMIGEPVPITFAFDAEMTFEYADLAGRFRLVRRGAAVPMASRRVVRVIERTVKSPSGRDDGLVHVVDSSRASGSVELTTRLVPRAEFERRALAALPPGAASRVQIPGGGPDLGGPVDWAHDRIVLYGTTWCGACRQAREFFRARGLEFVERNVEYDPEASAELAIKAAALGISADRVPVIDVRGRLLVGFDQVRLENLLGESV